MAKLEITCQVQNNRHKVIWYGQVIWLPYRMFTLLCLLALYRVNNSKLGWVPVDVLTSSVSATSVVWTLRQALGQTTHIVSDHGKQYQLNLSSKDIKIPPELCEFMADDHEIAKQARIELQRKVLRRGRRS